MGFTGEIHWGGTTVYTRAAGANEIGLSGRVTLGLSVGAQSWDAQSWGNATAVAASLGSAAENTAQNLTISLRGAMAATTTETVILNNFSVIRYPAQANP